MPAPMDCIYHPFTKAIVPIMPGVLGLLGVLLFKLIIWAITATAFFHRHFQEAIGLPHESRISGEFRNALYGDGTAIIVLSIRHPNRAAKTLDVLFTASDNFYLRTCATFIKHSCTGLADET